MRGSAVDCLLQTYVEQYIDDSHSQSLVALGCSGGHICVTIADSHRTRQ